MGEWLRLVVFRNKVRNADGKLKDHFEGMPIDYFEDEDEIYDAMEKGYIPPIAEELGIDPSAEIYDIVSLIEHENFWKTDGVGIRAWDEDGKAWYRTDEDCIWIRAPFWDKISKEERE